MRLLPRRLFPGRSALSWTIIRASEPRRLFTAPRSSFRPSWMHNSTLLKYPRTLTRAKTDNENGSSPTSFKFLFADEKPEDLEKESSNVPRELNTYEADWTLRYISVPCCPDMYIPKPEGIQMEVAYIDTAAHLGKKKRDSMPTVLATHGSPGSHEDFMGLARPLAEKGFRVIMPNYPGYNLTKSDDELTNKMFGHTLEERMDFLGNFVHRLKLPQVDLVIGHSASCYVLAALATRFSYLKKFVYICPGTAPKRPRGFRKSYILMRLMMFFWERALLRPIARAMISALTKPLTEGAIPYDGNVEPVVASLYTLAGAHVEEMPNFAFQMEATGTPLLYIYCDKDPLCAEEDNLEYANLYGVTPSAFDEYDKNGQLVNKGARPPRHYVHGIKFQKRSHFPLKSPRYCEIILEETMKLYHSDQPEGSS